MLTVIHRRQIVIAPCSLPLRTGLRGYARHNAHTECCPSFPAPNFSLDNSSYATDQQPSRRISAATFPPQSWLGPDRYLATHWPAVDALDRSQWPRTDLEIIMVRSCLFVSQAVARDMIAAGREKEVKEIQQAIDTVAPPLPENL